MSGAAERAARAWLWKAAAPVALPVLAGLTLLLIPLAVLAAPDQPAAASSRCSIGGTRGTVAGIELDAVQMGHAQTIVAVAAAQGLDPYAATVALATAYQESRIRMLANDGSSPELTAEQAAVTATSLQHAHDGLGSDHDSVNTFQQRWIAGWGTVAQLMDPVYAAAAFYDRLVEVPNWRTIPLTQAAQEVQVSAAGGAYARWAPFAGELTGMLWPTAQAIVADPARGASGVCPNLPVPAGSWIRPTAGQVTSGSGPRWGTLHAGVDIAGPRDSPVYAAGGGTVITAACTSAYCDRDGGLGLAGYGNLVELDHGGGVTTRYGHLSTYTVSAGQHVGAGTLVGFQGSTGNSTGVHLHFEVRQDGAPLDPVPWLADRGVDLNASNPG
ncbi:M23 family metallopeptidase [Blastococcus sp. MG754426]|uniref:Murein DD-endopeptidase MepM and murein hydrolase activator NlpD, contain LysM domain n=2 Tax=Geodermatophilaceae TaxID=85030 RepID=A0A285VG81_9ACTN|nr:MULTISPECIES: M23 family metallopeptidase [Geodermatophilaceae]MCF6506699.1 M23 family metallopeptidase [Blastococcus sp. MG754426]MCF6511511.1 M23 family metallopeptidase [Blastococcus sp. MG754427]SOC53085.1 Murein DD-endopeptidase MepM and murein hydrolase activator NlpD, contain LysM domain [Blastococcus aggregatus]SSC22120.1 peptidase M23 [Klenkia terrae]